MQDQKIQLRHPARLRRFIMADGALLTTFKIPLGWGMGEEAWRLRYEPNPTEEDWEGTKSSIVVRSTSIRGAVGKMRLEIAKYKNPEIAKVLNRMERI